MPYKLNYVPAEVALEHKGVLIYHAYNGGDIGEPLHYWFARNAEDSHPDLFDARLLPTYEAGKDVLNAICLAIDRGLIKNPEGQAASILPSSSPEILQPLPYRLGYLQVVPSETTASYFRLVYVSGDTTKELAQHANGFTCYHLGQLMLRHEPAAKLRAHIAYIRDCGGAAADYEEP